MVAPQVMASSSCSDSSSSNVEYRFDAPKSKITFVVRNVILGMEWDELFKYKVDKHTPLPSGESVDILAQEEEDVLHRMYSE